MKIYKLSLLFWLPILLCFIQKPTKGQSLSFDNSDLKSMTIIDSGKNSYLLLYCEAYCIKYGINEQRVLDTVVYSKEDSSLDIVGIVTNYRPVVVKSSIYFVENIGGGIIQYVNGLFRKIDNSYAHRLQFGSSLFVYNNLIHQYGGYGFFSNRDFITYYDTTLKSWELINPLKNKEMPIGTSANFSMIKGDYFYVFNGYYIDKQDRKKNNFLNELWQFNFKNNAWKKIGITNKDEHLSSFKYFQMENKLINLNEKGLISVIDIENNSVKKYKKTDFIQKMADNILPIYNKDFIYCIINNPIKNKLELYIRKKDDFLGEYVEEKKLYSAGFFDENKYLILFIGSFMLAIGGFIIYNKNRRKTDLVNKYITVKNDKIYYKNTLINLDEREIKIVKVLLQNPQGASTSQIMNLTEVKGLDYSHNIRQKNTKINNINLIFKASLNIDYDIIVSSKSEFDNRMRIYKIVLRKE